MPVVLMREDETVENRGRYGQGVYNIQFKTTKSEVVVVIDWNLSF